MGFELDSEQLLFQIHRLEAVSMSQLARLVCGGDQERCYRKVESLVDRGLLKTTPMARDKRERYVTLTTQGAAMVVEWLSSDTRNPRYIPPKRDRAIKMLAANEVYARAVEAGLPENVCLSRREALTKHQLDHRVVPLVWLFELGEARYAIYVPWTARFRTPLRKAIMAVPSEMATAHILVRPSVPKRREDRGEFLKDSPAANFHVIDYAHLPLLVESLRNPHAGLDLLKERLRVVAPGGRIYPSRDPMLPPWVLERKTRFVLGDMRLENVGLGARLLTHTQESLKAQGHEGVILLVSTVQQAKEWAKLLGMRDWIWFIVQSDALEECLWRVKGGVLRRVRFKTKVAKEGGHVVQTA